MNRWARSLLMRAAIGILASAAVVGTTPNFGAANASTNMSATQSTSSLTSLAAGTPKTLAAAQAKWPGASLLPNGVAHDPGRYLIHLSTGYALVQMSAINTVPKTVSTERGAFVAMGCGSWERGLYTQFNLGLGLVTFKTDNYTPNTCGRQANVLWTRSGCYPYQLYPNPCVLYQGTWVSGQGTYTAWASTRWTAYEGVWPFWGGHNVTCTTGFSANGQTAAWCSG